MVELALPHLVGELGVEEVVLAGGEPVEQEWREALQRKLAPRGVTVLSEPAFLYFSEQNSPPDAIGRRLEKTLESLLPQSHSRSAVVWAHNLGIGRNLLLARALAGICQLRHIPLILHHHDWWFDNRWGRWPEFQRCGLRGLRRVAQVLFPAGPRLYHVAINRADADLIESHGHPRVDWWPNLTSAAKGRRQPIQAARRWLQDRLGIQDQPIWIMPTRLLRRKNMAEAMLLTGWLRPEAWFVSTGAISSADELAYSNTLQEAARQHQWRVRLSLLQGTGSHHPDIPDLLGASETVLLTSLQEGFGLPYLEAVAARRPLLARAIPNIMPDLHQFGFTFPQLYNEILIDPVLFDWEAERKRQRRLFRAWRAGLPKACRPWAESPPLLLQGARPQPMAFSRLTLTAQLEVLTRPRDESWKRCAPLNPFLLEWRKCIQNGGLEASPWPDSADQWLSGGAYARRFSGLLARPSAVAGPGADGPAIQETFIHRNLRASNLYPLLWSIQT